MKYFKALFLCANMMFLGYAAAYVVCKSHAMQLHWSADIVVDLVLCGTFFVGAVYGFASKEMK
jgi:hypothetical protein